MHFTLKYSVDGGEPESFEVSEFPVIFGTLLSNQIVLRVPGVEPIHAMIEQDLSGGWLLTDLGSELGIEINGQRVVVEQLLNVGDSLSIAGVQVSVLPAVQALQIGQMLPVEASQLATHKAAAGFSGEDSPNSSHVEMPSPAALLLNNTQHEQTTPAVQKELLFSPKNAKPSGDVLECVAYWNDTIIDVELFHPSIRGYEAVNIGDNEKNHFPAAGSAPLNHHTLATVSESGFKLNLLPGMEARLRTEGKVDKKIGPAVIKLGRRDLAHIKHGPINYFLLFVRPPSLQLPKTDEKDVILWSFGSLAMLIYLILLPLVWLSPIPEKKEHDDDLLYLVTAPKKLEITQQIPPPKQKIEEIKELPQQVKPPPPKPPPPKPAPAVEKPKPEQKKPVEKPVEIKQTVQAPKAEVTPPTPKPVKSEGAVATVGDSKPDQKKVGPKTASNDPRTGGAKGGGKPADAGERKGNQALSERGVEDAKQKAPSGVNLDKLGIGVGKLSSLASASAIKTNLQSSAGGAGAGSGSGARTVGTGGMGSRSGLAIAGSGGAANQFGAGSGGMGSGQNGRGGLSNAAGGGRKGVTIDVPTEPDFAGAGLTSQEIMDVIRANLNQIRACYESSLQRRPGLSGKIQVKFIIGKTGNITGSPEITADELKDGELGNCITSRIRAWKFPEPRGASAVTVKYPFVLNPV